MDPIGKWRDELGWATLCSLVTNHVRQIYTKKGHPVNYTTATDFMIDWGNLKQEKPEPKKQSVEEMKEIILDIAEKQNKRVKKGKSNKRVKKGKS